MSGDLLRSAQVHDRYTNNSRIIKKLKALDMLEEDFNIQAKRGWIFRPLAECRRNWEDRNRGVWQWHIPLSSLFADWAARDIPEKKD